MFVQVDFLLRVILGCCGNSAKLVTGIPASHWFFKQKPSEQKGSKMTLYTNTSLIHVLGLAAHR